MTSTLTETETREQLWNAALAKVNELAPHGNRGQAHYGADGHTCLVVAEKDETDGTRSVYQIEARDYYGKLDVTVRRTTDNCEPFWQPIIDAAGDRNEVVVTGDRCYTIRPDRDEHGRGSSGFGGRRFTIAWLGDDGQPTGETTETRNLWSRGVIPPAFRGHLKPNARIESSA